MPRKRTEAAAESPEPSGFVGPVKPKIHLWSKRGFALRPRTGGGRIPILFAVMAEDEKQLDILYDLKNAEVEGEREYKFEALGEWTDEGESKFPEPLCRFFIGHGVSMWKKKDIEQQFGG